MATTSDIVIRLDEIEQLFNAPAVNPYSDKSVNVYGESALTRASRRLLAQPGRGANDARLVIKLPPNKITPGLQQATVEAVRRYTDARIEDNELSMRLSRRLGLVGLLLAILVSLAAIGIFTLLLAGPFAGASEVVRGWLLAFVGILSWVALWDPLSKLLFEWVGPWLHNGILRRIQAMPIVIEPQGE